MSEQWHGSSDARSAAAKSALTARLGLLAGAALLAATLLLPAPGTLGDMAWRVCGVAALMVLWWVTEALPVAVTGLVPIVALPLLGVVPLAEVTSAYGHPLIFLFLGGFLLAATIERWGLHRRLALHILRLAGSGPRSLVAGFMLATALLSMWLSNTATTILMLPIGASVIGLVGSRLASAAGEPPGPDARNFPIALMLGIAYAASIGGLATLIGTPPNALLAAYLEESRGLEIGFADWMLLALPIAMLLLALAWLLLVRLVYPLRKAPVEGVEAIIARELQALGPLGRGERLAGGLFLCTALAWLTRPLIEQLWPGLQLSDTAIALAGALAAFLIPARGRDGGGKADRLLDWASARKIPWGVLLLFGGGLSLASAIESSGLSPWFADLLVGLEGLPTILVVLLVAALIVFLTEVTSNTATAALFIPLMAGVASGLGLAPLQLVLPVTLAASCAFMMPVATPPNAIVYAGGHLRVADMARAGLWLNLLAVALIGGYAGWLVPILGP